MVEIVSFLGSAFLPPRRGLINDAGEAEDDLPGLICASIDFSLTGWSAVGHNGSRIGHEFVGSWDQ